MYNSVTTEWIILRTIVYIKMFVKRKSVQWVVLRVLPPFKIVKRQIESKLQNLKFFFCIPTIHHVTKILGNNTFFSSIPTHAYLLSHIKGKCNNLKLNLVYAKRGVNKVCMENAFVCDTTTVCLIMEKEKCHIWMFNCNNSVVIHKSLVCFV